MNKTIRDNDFSDFNKPLETETADRCFLGSHPRAQWDHKHHPEDRAAPYPTRTHLENFSFLKEWDPQTLHLQQL
jgi:hypothetical protein